MIAKNEVLDTYKALNKASTRWKRTQETKFPVINCEWARIPTQNVSFFVNLCVDMKFT
jgi:hypothetical protein